MPPRQKSHYPAWLNLRLIEDLAGRLEVDDLLGWIESHTAKLARAGWMPVPGRIELLPTMLRSTGIVGVNYVVQGRGMAELRAEQPGRYQVQMHSFAHFPLRRFWLAHEIAHTFWFAPDSAAKPLSPWQSQFADDPTIEWLCNRAAAALLIPRGLLERNLAGYDTTLRADPPQFHLLWELADKYRVPVQVLARRWLHDLGDSTWAVIGLRPDEHAPKTAPGMMIEWHCTAEMNEMRVRNLYGRKIPRAALPEVPKGTTRRLSIDNRWWPFLEQIWSKGRAIPFAQLRESGRSIGVVARRADFLSEQMVVAFRPPDRFEAV